MSTKRATIYFNAKTFRILKIKAAETSQTMSEIVNDAVEREIMEDQEDLAAFKEREGESSVSYESFLAELKRDGKV